MVRFGAITIDVSHPKTFSETLKLSDRGRYTAVFNDGFRGEDEVEAFAANNSLKICSSLEELADEVDVGMVHCCNWDKHLGYLTPFVERGKPVFIDKPLVGNLADARALLRLCEGGGKIIGTSALRYAEEVLEAKKAIAEAGASVMHIDVSVGVDEFNYAIHAYETVCTLIDSPPRSVKYVGRAEKDGHLCNTYMIFFEGGETACVHNFMDRFALFCLMILTDNGAGDRALKLDNSKLYASMLNEICNYAEGKESLLAPMDQLLIPIRVALACKASLEAGGTEVAIDSPSLEEVSFDGYEFGRGYAAAAAKAPKMYVKE